MPIQVGGTGDLFAANGDVVTDIPTLDVWFEYDVAGPTPAAPINALMSNVQAALSTDGKTLTLTFTGPAAGGPVYEGDIVRSAQAFTSAIDPSQTESISASANGPVAP